MTTLPTIAEVYALTCNNTSEHQNLKCTPLCEPTGPYSPTFKSPLENFSIQFLGLDCPPISSQALSSVINIAKPSINHLMQLQEVRNQEKPGREDALTGRISTRKIWKIKINTPTLLLLCSTLKVKLRLL
jgi:hypothetical protein